MDRLIAANSVPLSGADTYPGAGTPQYATSGNPIGPIPATVFPAYAWNMLQEEIRQVITLAGITPNGTNWTQLAQAIMALAGKNIQIFSSSGTFTVPALVTALDVEGWAPGGGSGGTSGAGSGGGAGAGGGFFRKLITGLVPGALITVTIGSPGTGGNSTPTSGTAGGSISFGAYASATGGAGGTGALGAVQSLAVLGGNGAGGDINLSGGSPTQPFALGTGAILAASGGAASGVSFAAQGYATAAVAGTAGQFPGGGASGAVNGGAGANGGAGLIIVRW